MSVHSALRPPRNFSTVNVCQRTDEPRRLPAEVMCRVQREKTWCSGQRGCILWPCQDQNGNPSLGGPEPFELSAGRNGRQGSTTSQLSFVVSVICRTKGGSGGSRTWNKALAMQMRGLESGGSMRKILYSSGDPFRQCDVCRCGHFCRHTASGDQEACASRKVLEIPPGSRV